MYEFILFVCETLTVLSSRNGLITKCINYCLSANRPSTVVCDNPD